MFNLAQDQQINPKVLDEILSKQTSTWLSFSNEGFKKAINKCSNLFTPRPDCIL